MVIEEESQILQILLYGRAPDLKKSPLDLLIRGSDNFVTMESYFGGLKSLCDNFYYMTLNIY